MNHSLAFEIENYFGSHMDQRLALYNLPGGGGGGGGHSSILVYTCVNKGSKNTPLTSFDFPYKSTPKQGLNKDLEWYMNISLPKQGTQNNEILKI